MVVTVTTSTNNRYRSAEGTLAEILNYIDVNKIPDEKIINTGYSGISGKIFFVVFRLSEI